MPRGPKIETKDMSPEDYEKKFGRRKPGPKAGARKPAKATVKAAKAGPKLKKDGTPRKKPGPKAGKATFAKATTSRKSGAEAPWGYKKDGTPRKPPGRKASANGKKETLGAVPTAGRKGPSKTGTKSGRAAQAARGADHDSAGPGKDLGPPPPSRARQYALVKEIVSADLDADQLAELAGVIEERLIGDISDLDSDDLGAVAELQSNGYSKLGAINTVRKDKQAVVQQAASEAEADEKSEEVEEETTAEAAPADDDVDEQEEGEETNPSQEAPPAQAAAPTS